MEKTTPYLHGNTILKHTITLYAPRFLEKKKIKQMRKSPPPTPAMKKRSVNTA